MIFFYFCEVFSYKEIFFFGYLELIVNMFGCFVNLRIIRCLEMCYYKRFRFMDGLCNNFYNLIWGVLVIVL